MLISGTARGMGRAAALEFAAQGAAVFGCDLDEKASAETVEPPIPQARKGQPRGPRH